MNIEYRLFSMLVILLFFSCQSDDGVVCPTIQEKGLVTIELSLAELPGNIYTRSTNLIYKNLNGDSLVFIPEMTLDNSFEVLYEKECEGEGITTEIYLTGSRTRDFSSLTTNHSISFTAQVNQGSKLEENSQTGIEYIRYDCFGEILTFTLRDENEEFSSIQKSFNPDSCEVFGVSEPQYFISNNVVLNGITYEGEIWISNGLNSTSNDSITLYYSTSEGLVGFRNALDIVWNLNE